jgi:hypothetical protein
VQIFDFQLFPRCGFLRGKGTALFIIGLDNVVPLSVEFAHLGIGALHSLRSLDFNKRRGRFERLQANKPELDRPSSLNFNRIRPEKPV